MLTAAVDLGHDFDHQSIVLGRSKVARVLAPPTRDLRGCPLLILLHPFAGSRHSWVQHAPELLTRLGEECLVVMPECGRRWFIDDHSGARYESYLADELLPTVRREFRADGPASVGGFSMGGASSFFLALRRPGLFASALAVAGAFLASDREGDPYEAVRTDDLMIPTEAEHERVWGPAGSDVRQRYDPASMVAGIAAQAARPKFYFEVGRADFPRMIAASLCMKELLTTAGLPFAFSQNAGDHGWSYAADGMARLVAAWRSGVS